VSRDSRMDIYALGYNWVSLSEGRALPTFPA
jgi:hypothetical protein